MAKNYKSIYESALDSSSLNQAFYLKKEAVNGSLIAPLGSDFFYTIAGGSMSFSQPIEPSAHRSGRHNNNTIKKKKALEWSLPVYVNIDTGVAAGASEIDPAIATLWESALGRKTIDGGVIFDSVNDPSITFSVLEVGDMWAKQAYGCFVDTAEISLPGDGESQITFSGMGVESYLVGISASSTANIANEVTVQAGHGKRFPVGSLVMIIKNDGVTRSSDTPTGSPRKVVTVVGDVVTLDGAALEDADGTVDDVYLVYYEPTSAVAIDNPQTGLVGEFASMSMGGQCVRSATISIANGNEAQNFCFGTDALSGSIFVPASRLQVTASVEVNMNKQNVGLYNDVQAFVPQDLVFVLGDSSSRRLEVYLPKVIFNIPPVEVPDSGSIPVTFEGTAYQTALGEANEVTVVYQ
jgi:hypothetical protein